MTVESRPTPPKLPPKAQQLYDALILLEERDHCRDDPANLLRVMRCWDERAGVEFGFNMDSEGDWAWQKDVVRWQQENKRTIFLKARQIGVTWIGCALSLWTALYQPGSLCLMYRQKHADAIKLAERCYYQFNSLPKHLQNKAKVIKPTRDAPPGEQGIWFQFPDGKISRIQPQSSADASGHGETSAFVLLDEFARIDNAPEIMKAVSSAVGQTGRLFIISTANGVSNDQGGGNYFHYLWSHADEQGLAKQFLSWRLHPDRDEKWFTSSPEILNLRPWERAEQYPDNEHEAFAITSANYFDAEAMHDYASLIREPEYRCEFVRTMPGRAKLAKKENGWISVFAEPEPDRKYAIGVDTATGRGLDYSAAYVVDLQHCSIVAEVHGKIENDLFAEQLAFLGNWYNRAILAIESAGGWGDAVTVDLRDGRDGRRPYPNLYRHRQFTRGDIAEHKPFGFPMTNKTRPQVLSHMEELVREKSVPFLPSGLLTEMQTFSRYNPNKPDAGGTWPRAWPDGLHDDRVMACAIALEMYRQFGEHPEKVKRPHKRRYRSPQPWLQEVA